MNDRLTAATRDPQTAGGSRRCQAERCPLPASLLPWRLDCGGMTIELRLCDQHGQVISQAKVTFGDDEVAA